MIVTTTPTIEGRRIASYRGIVSGEAILGANVFRDFFASIRDVVGGRSGSYERVLRDGRDTALQEMMEEAQRLGAHAIVGVHMDYGAIGKNEGMMMVTVSGTAVTLEEAPPFIAGGSRTADGAELVCPILDLCCASSGRHRW